MQEDRRHAPRLEREDLSHRPYINDCVNKARAMGVAVRVGTWGLKYENGLWVVDQQAQGFPIGSCVLGTVLLIDGKGIDGKRPEFPWDAPRPADAAAAVLEVTKEWIGAFCEGASGYAKTTYAEKYIPVHKLGESFFK